MTHELRDLSAGEEHAAHHTRSPTRGVLAALGLTAAVTVAAVIGRLTMLGKGKPTRPWFRALRKPSFQPPSWMFGPVWTILYGAIAYSGWRVMRAPQSRQRSRALQLWGVQLALNAGWTPLFFGARRPALALVDICALDAAAAAYAASARKVDGQAAIVVSPYLAWIGFATLLNASIVAKNR